MAKECVQVKIEIGHKSVCRTEVTQNGFTHDWFVFVRGTEGSNISHFVDKVVFYLHESFPKPRRVLKEPPYKLEESGYGSFMLPIEIYFKNKDEPKKVRVEYDLFLQLVGNPPVNNVRVEAITFSDPLEDFKKRLLKAGGVVLPPAQMGLNLTSPNTETPAPLYGRQEALPPNQSVCPQLSPTLKKTKVSPLPYVDLSPLLMPKSKPKDTAGLLNGSSNTKRISSADDSVGSMQSKLKKKRTDRQGETAQKNPAVDQLTPSSPLDLDSDKGRNRTLPNSTKKNKDTKERRRSVDAFSPTLAVKKPLLKDNHHDVKQPRGKEMKDTTKLTTKPDKTKKDESKPKTDMKIVQKITMKRTSDESWASSLRRPPVGSILPGKKLDGLMSDLKDDSSSDEENSSNVISKQVSESKEVLPSLKFESVNTPITKTTKPKKLAKKNEGSAKSNGVRRKDSRSQIKCGLNGKTSKMVPSLLELHRRICAIQDGRTLQKVVDIVGGTGLFEITSSTFDFDLCTLDQDTINRLQCSLSETVS